MDDDRVLLIDRSGLLKWGLLRQQWEQVHIQPTNLFESVFLSITQRFPVESIMILLGLARGDFRLEQSDFVWELIHENADKIAEVDAGHRDFVIARIKNRFKLQRIEMEKGREHKD